MNSSIRSMNLHKENSQSQCRCFNIVGEGQGTHQQSTALLFKTTSVELTTTPMIFYFQNKMRHSYNPWRPPWNAQSVFEIIKMKHLTPKCITEYLQKKNDKPRKLLSLYQSSQLQSKTKTSHSTTTYLSEHYETS